MQIFNRGDQKSILEGNIINFWFTILKFYFKQNLAEKPGLENQS